MTADPQDVLNEIMRLSRFHYQAPQPWMYSSLVRQPPPVKPRRVPTTEIVRTPAYEAPVAVERPPAAPAAVEDENPSAELRQGPVWLLGADVSVWRTRWFWRLAASLWVRRERWNSS